MNASRTTGPEVDGSAERMPVAKRTVSDLLDRSLGPALAALAVVLVVSEFTSVDLWVQDRLFDFGRGRWLIDRDAGAPRFWFYNAPKGALIATGLVLLSLAAGPARWRRRLDRRALWVAFLTLGSVPALIGWGKSVTNVFCPSELRRYGGDIPYVKLFESYPDSDRPARCGRCFPAGHASGGFALVALAGLGRTRRRRWIGAAIGLGIGGAMGAYQMAKGAHFLSHTLVTLLSAWCVFLLWRRVAAIVARRFGARSDSASAPPAGAS